LIRILYDKTEDVGKIYGLFKIYIYLTITDNNS